MVSFLMYLNPAKFYHFFFTGITLSCLFLPALSAHLYNCTLTGKALDQTQLPLLLLESVWISWQSCSQGHKHITKGQTGTRKNSALRHFPPDGDQILEEAAQKKKLWEV